MGCRVAWWDNEIRCDVAGSVGVCRSRGTYPRAEDDERERESLLSVPLIADAGGATQSVRLLESLGFADAPAA